MASDESLVLRIRNRKRSPQDRSDAARELGNRYKSLLCGRVYKEIQNQGQFLAATAAVSIEAFCADVLGKACQTWRQRAGSSFSTWVYLLLSQAIIDAQRNFKKVPKALVDRDGEDLTGRLEDRSGDSSPLDRLALQEVLELARACLAELPERSRQVFVWTVFLGMTYDDIRTIWPHLSVVNLKQIKHRASGEFVVKWAENGGADVEAAAQSLAGAVADRVDAARIKNPRAREAYLAWVKYGDLAKAAKQLKMKVAKVRPLLHEAMRDLFEQGMIRGEAIEKRKMSAKDVARAVELAETGDLKDSLAERIDHILQLVRAAFGFARPERAIHTLGSLIQSRLDKIDDYDRACRELGLKAAALRKLLADELDPEQTFYDRLATFLQMSVDQVRALPRRPAGGTRFRLRSKSDFDDAAFLARMMAWIKT